MCTDQIILPLKQKETYRFSVWLIRGVLLMIAVFAVMMLVACRGYQWRVEPDGIHSVKQICYKDKGCVVQDCVTHYEATEKQSIYTVYRK